MVDDTVTTLRYLGGPFIIDASDAAKALDLLQNDPDFALFRGAVGTATCAPGAARGVVVHRANNQFTAPIARILNETPPRIALIDGGALNVLIDYLDNAGLNFPGAQGTFTAHGAIFDVLQDNEDLRSTTQYPGGKLNWAPDPNKPTDT